MNIHIIELESICKKLNVKYKIHSREFSENIMSKTFLKFKPFRTIGHVQIGCYAISIPEEENIYSFSLYLKEELVYLFFEESEIDRRCVFEVEDGRLLGKILEQSSGLEFFLTNKEISYLMAINWYTIEGIGIVQDWMKFIKNNEYNYC